MFRLTFRCSAKTIIRSKCSMMQRHSGTTALTKYLFSYVNMWFTFHTVQQNTKHSGDMSELTSNSATG
jgi:hypothetical protein